MTMPSLNLKSEVRNPRSERNPKPEARKVPPGGAARRHFFTPVVQTDFGLRISDFFRASAIRISEFRLNLPARTNQTSRRTAACTAALALLCLLAFGPTAYSASLTIWPTNAVPALVDAGDAASVELGVHFRSDVDGQVTGLRFYKAASNTGAHLGHLWDTNGTLLATATFVGESASGWQQASFPAPFTISSNTLYIASYYAPDGHYSADVDAFATSYDNPPLHAPATNEIGNGIYTYTTNSNGAFPTNASGNAANYWVDVVFETGPDTNAPVVSAVTPTAGAIGVPLTTTVTVTFSEAMTAASVTTNTFILRDALNALVPAAVTYDINTLTATLVPAAPLMHSAIYAATVKGDAGGVTDLAGNPLAGDYTWSFRAADFSLWDDSAVPLVASANDTSAVELGLKFQSAVAGHVRGIRFYKGPTNTAPHVGHLWTSNGTLLASVNFTNETAGGWQTQALPALTPIDSNTTYVVSYLAPSGGYAADTGYFLAGGLTNQPLRALADGAEGGNGVYLYTTNSTGEFPTNSFNGANYWVDVVFSTNTAPVAFSQNITNGWNTPFPITLTGSDEDGPQTNFVIVANPVHGSLSGTAPSLTYTPVTNYSGPDSFTFTVNDGVLTSAVATVSITLTNGLVFNPPVAFSQSVTNAEDAAFPITLTASDPDGPMTNYVVVSSPAHGTLTGTAPNLTYLGFTNYFGPDSFQFQVNDGSLTSAVATVSISLTNVNDAPVATNNSISILEDTSTNLVLTASDVEGASLTFAILAAPANGTLTGLNPSTGAVSYSPNTNYSGADSFQFTASDGSLLATGTVSITVVAVDDPAQAVDQFITLPKDTSTNLVLTATDLDSTNSVSDVMAVTAAVAPDNWTTNGLASKVSAVAANDGNTSYLTSGGTANTQQQFTLADPPHIQPGDTINSVTLRATCRRNSTPGGNYQVTAVLGANTSAGATHATGSGYVEDSDTFITRPGGGAWTLADVQNLQVRIQNTQARDIACTKLDALVNFIGSTNRVYAILAAPTNGVLGTLNPNNGLVSYTPNAGYTGADSFAFTVNAGGVLSTGLVSILVTGTNNAPFAITAISVSDDVATITWDSVSNQTYRLEYKNELTITNWTEVPVDVPATGPSTSTTNLLGGAPQRFYRVK
jgi:hypothetical protein